MNLKDYLYKNEIKQCDFAERLKISRNLLWSILKGNHDMKLSLALKIEKETNGLVKCKDLLLSKNLKKEKSTQN